MLEKYPNHFDRIVNAYKSACDRVPCILGTRSDGRHLYYFSENYTGKEKYSCKDDKSGLMEYFGVKGSGYVTNKYSQLEGSILDIPTILNNDALTEIRNIILEVSDQEKVIIETVDIAVSYTHLTLPTIYSV